MSMHLSLTNYAYDAAGRMIKEGNKTYEYGWLDKVLKVTENGKTLADFEYHNNGQIAKAIRPDKTENFLWDGLALVKRDDTKFINEPHAGGGNPVLAIQDVDVDKSKAIFTDMLGTSLGSTVEDQYNNISKTSFGADTTDTSAFFTGKPYVNELGYTFLLRNYRADTGKWLSQDLIGYPDGWNNFSYCENSITYSIDLLGAAGINLLAKPGGNATPSEKGIYDGGNVLVNDNTGFYVIAHGDPKGISSTVSGDYMELDAIVDAIKNAPKYDEYDTVDLIACNTGKGGDESFAKKLAEALKKPVKAPDCEITVHSNGFYTLSDPNGKYVTYE